MKDYHSDEDFFEEINWEDVPVLDEKTVKMWVYIALPIMIFTLVFVFRFIIMLFNGKI